MREILFRGKRQDNGEWVEGAFVGKYDPMLCISYAFIVAQKPKDSFVTWYAVDPNTVGQYTGLCVNGQKIFEGDIVEGPCHSAWRHDTQRCVVAYGRYGFECRHHVDGLDSDYYTYKVLFSKKVEVIGNIHDNPELLKGE